jgi:hypothetical protein
MGATLGHLLVFNFNLTKMELCGMHSSIDYAVSKPFVKATQICPTKKMLEEAKWDKNDRVVRIVAIPCVMEPQGYVMDCSKEEEAKDDVFLVSCTYTHNDLENGCKIVNFTCTTTTTNETKTYNINDFKDADIPDGKPAEAEPEVKLDSDKPVENKRSGKNSETYKDSTQMDPNYVYDFDTKLWRPRRDDEKTDNVTEPMKITATPPSPA